MTEEKQKTEETASLNLAAALVSEQRVQACRDLGDATMSMASGCTSAAQESLTNALRLVTQIAQLEYLIKAGKMRARKRSLDGTGETPDDDGGQS